MILPLATPKPYTYYVPEEFLSGTRGGVRVEVQFGRGNKRYAALVLNVHENRPQAYQPKPILSVIDEEPIVLPVQLSFWQWVAEYYCCSLGEVMHAALPAHLKLASETLLRLHPDYEEGMTDLDDQAYLVAEALTIQETINIDDVRGILGKQTVYPLIRKMLAERIIVQEENLKEKYKPRTVSCVRLQEPYRSQPARLEEAFERCGNSNRQVEALMAYIHLSRSLKAVRRTDIYKAATVDSSVLRALEKKGILELYQKEISRIEGYEAELEDQATLSSQQSRALEEIRQILKTKAVALLHGVTGSGKTQIYMELMREALNRGEQVLYLLPEIALTTQLIQRLQRVFGDAISVYHSRLNNNERVELWQAALEGKPMVMGARSALFLPFRKLGLVVVDEEHDSSYKQQDPNPRYNGRDAAIYLAQLHGAKTLLGTATPSVESFQNAKEGKFGLVRMAERFGGLELPTIAILDARATLRRKKVQTHFTGQLIEAMEKTLESGEQIILFQNRRGYAPAYRCSNCGWHAQCLHCDVSLTYHKYHKELKCHYCGYRASLVNTCPACGSPDLRLQGFGTEKIEDELKIFLPDARIGRLDLETARSKFAHARIINDFEEGRLDILVGTQMVTKGLDFDHVGLVGVLSADQLLHFPDFRASERAFQLMVQVAGRAGRKHRQGKVLIQAVQTNHPVLADVVHQDFKSFYERELEERLAFRYPPFQRLIKITLKHTRPQTLNDATRIFDHDLKKPLGQWLIGPAVPHISRIRKYYLMDFLLKLPRKAAALRFAKERLLDAALRLQAQPGMSGVRVSIDVDPA